MFLQCTTISIYQCSNTLKCFLSFLSLWSLSFYSYTRYTSLDLHSVFNLSSSQPVRTRDFQNFFCSSNSLTSSDWSQEKTEALLFSLCVCVSPSCPSSFRLFAGSETRQNERMWDRQPWNGGQGLWGVCDFVHICLWCVWAHGKITWCFPFLCCWYVRALKHRTYISVSMFV